MFSSLKTKTLQKTISIHCHLQIPHITNTHLTQWKMDGNKRNLNCFYSIFAKKRNSHSHFKYIKNHKIIPRNCCFGVITLCSPKNVLFISMILNLNCFYSIFAKKRNSHGHFKYIKKI